MYYAEFRGRDEESDEIRWIKLRLPDNDEEARDVFKALDDFFLECEISWGTSTDEMCPIDADVANRLGFLERSVIANLIDGEIQYFQPGSLDFTDDANHMTRDTDYQLEMIRNEKISSKNISVLKIVSPISITQEVEVTGGIREIDHEFIQARDEDGLVYHIAYKCKKRTLAMSRPVYILFSKFYEDKNSIGIGNSWVYIEQNAKYNIYSNKTEFDILNRGWQHWKRIDMTIYDGDGSMLTTVSKFFDLGSMRNRSRFEHRIDVLVIPWAESIIAKYNSAINVKYTYDLSLYVCTIKNENKKFKGLDKKKLSRKKYQSGFEEFKNNRTKRNLEYVEIRLHGPI